MIKDAIIKEGQLYCSSCNNILGLIKDHDIIQYKEDKYFLFTRYCSTRGCFTTSRYYANITIESREIFIFPYKECKKIKDEQIKIKEEE